MGRLQSEEQQEPPVLEGYMMARMVLVHMVLVHMVLVHMVLVHMVVDKQAVDIPVVEDIQALGGHVRLCI